MVAALARLLAMIGSADGGVCDTVAVFETEVPGSAVMFAMIVRVADPAAPIRPRFAVTVPFVPTLGPLQVPMLGTHETKVVPVGSGSFTVTLFADPGPLLVTTTM